MIEASSDPDDLNHQLSFDGFHHILVPAIGFRGDMTDGQRRAAYEAEHGHQDDASDQVPFEVEPASAARFPERIDRRGNRCLRGGGLARRTRPELAEEKCPRVHVLIAIPVGPEKLIMPPSHDASKRLRKKQSD
ncbi:protein of unknown function [Methylorubrum extorquens]|uniref:Uncharacterized protein n=1 Tax=Methylorubrum extorquens TaxID=408 RepID=A0A2N9AN55_METEX|nr:protein of unknown function [Methylorubrum extorquens]